MSVAVTGPTPRVRPARESRPPCHTWRRDPPAPIDQPPLDLQAALWPPRTSAVLRPSWGAIPPPHLPDAPSWAASIGQALVDAMYGRRPVSQLLRWVAEPVLADVSAYCRRRSQHLRRSAGQAIVQSVRVQHPVAEVAEVAAHVVVAGQSVALAFRLEARRDYWFCTALEIGPRSPRG